MPPLYSKNTFGGVIGVSAGGGVAQTGVYYGTGLSPTGVVTAAAPAIYYSTTDRSIWLNTGASANNTFWV